MSKDYRNNYEQFKRQSKRIKEMYREGKISYEQSVQRVNDLFVSMGLAD